LLGRGGGFKKKNKRPKGKKTKVSQSRETVGGTEKGVGNQHSLLTSRKTGVFLRNKEWNTGAIRKHRQWKIGKERVGRKGSVERSRESEAGKGGKPMIQIQ